MRRLWDNCKPANMHVVGVPEGEEEEQETENSFQKIMEETVPNLAKEIDIQVQEAQRVMTSLPQTPITAGVG